MSLRSIGTPQKASIPGGVGSGSVGGGGLRTVTGGTTGKAKFPATLIWGATGEQEWTAGLTTGMCTFVFVRVHMVLVDSCGWCVVLILVRFYSFPKQGSHLVMFS